MSHAKALVFSALAVALLVCAPAVRAQRAQVLDAAYTAHPERFVSKPPAPPKLPGTSWINPPQEKETSTQ